MTLTLLFKCSCRLMKNLTFDFWFSIDTYGNKRTSKLPIDLRNLRDTVWQHLINIYEKHNRRLQACDITTIPSRKSVSHTMPAN